IVSVLHPRLGGPTTRATDIPCLSIAAAQVTLIGAVDAPMGARYRAPLNFPRYPLAPRAQCAVQGSRHGQHEIGKESRSPIRPPYRRQQSAAEPHAKLGTQSGGGYRFRK